MRQRWEKGIKFFHKQKGMTLIEVVFAVALLAIIGVTVLRGIETNARASRILDEQVESANLATAYFEAIRQMDYSNNSTAYSSAGDNITVPPQYSVAINLQYSNDGTTWADNYTDENLQKITVSILREGKTVLSICTLRADR